MTTLTRRTFLRSLGSGLLVAAAPVVPEPFVRRLWQVGRNAPVAAREPLWFERTVDTGLRWDLLTNENAPPAFYIAEGDIAPGDIVQRREDNGRLERALTLEPGRQIVGVVAQVLPEGGAWVCVGSPLLDGVPLASLPSREAYRYCSPVIVYGDSTLRRA